MHRETQRQLTVAPRHKGCGATEAPFGFKLQIAAFGALFSCARSHRDCDLINHAALPSTNTYTCIQIKSYSDGESIDDLK